jgi:nucleoside-diphosphate-sugar epimerase
MIGFRVLVNLLEVGYSVRAAVRTAAGFDKIRSLKPVAPYASNLTQIFVPDITAPGAYDEAVKGVKYIIHVASPLDANLPMDVDYEKDMIEPAVKGTLGVLESANKVRGIKRIVITGSVLSIIGFSDLGNADVLDGESNVP